MNLWNETCSDYKTNNIFIINNSCVDFTEPRALFRDQVLTALPLKGLRLNKAGKVRLTSYSGTFVQTHTCSGKAINIEYYEYVCSLSCPACQARAPC